MIVRASPLGSGPNASEWLLIPQQEHARLSHTLASAWGNDRVPPLICPRDEPGHPLAAVRDEFLQAMLHHDDGWAEWWQAPGVDPETARPYAFTDMPPADAQRLWSASIDHCRAIGPLAGWVVASHFSQLQSKQDDDYDQWRDWLARVDHRRSGWLEEWLAASRDHTENLAGRCLAWLQAFDWLSLWLCCKCPHAHEPPADPGPLELGPQGHLPKVTFTPHNQAIKVGPWPFAESELALSVKAKQLSSGNQELAWKLNAERGN